MNKLLRVFIVLALLAQLSVWLICPRVGHGAPSFDERYRGTERAQAYFHWLDEPSPTNTARWEDEMNVLHSHVRVRDSALFVLVAAFDAAMVFLFWNYGAAKTVR